MERKTIEQIKRNQRIFMIIIIITEEKENEGQKCLK